ncbi:MAG: glycosyltransferase family 2 protein, partial [Planctomycetes bacterium]|nr:glycosyltransferase family 2 protein [Planctomycetota bacterium]
MSPLRRLFGQLTPRNRSPSPLHQGPAPTTETSHASQRPPLAARRDDLWQCHLRRPTRIGPLRFPDPDPRRAPVSHRRRERRSRRHDTRACRGAHQQGLAHARPRHSDRPAHRHAVLPLATLLRIRPLLPLATPRLGPARSEHPLHAQPQPRAPARRHPRPPPDRLIKYQGIDDVETPNAQSVRDDVDPISPANRDQHLSLDTRCTPPSTLDGSALNHSASTTPLRLRNQHESPQVRAFPHSHFVPCKTQHPACSLCLTSMNSRSAETTMDLEQRSSGARSVVALLATRGRFDLLAQRAIPSILAQTQLPNRILIVVDHDRSELPDEALGKAEAELRALCQTKKIPLSVRRNRRTARRASGAWNTGLDQLHRENLPTDLWFVAILDDDDAWEPDHLSCCLESAMAGDLNMVASGLIRHEAVDASGHRQSIPDRLDARELYVRGQHIQGSNLFVRLDMLLFAGGFDERLPSCTDRDLCIRLAALEQLRFGRTDRHTVHHYADTRVERLSTPGSEAKLEGLSRFLSKHGYCFDAQTRREAEARATQLFGWSPVARTLPVVEITDTVPPEDRIDLVIGFITDAKPPSHAAGLLDDLLALRARPEVRSLRVVIVENGPKPSDDRPLHELVARYERCGLPIELVTIERQRKDWERGELLDVPDMTAKRLPIAASRSILNTYVARSASVIAGAAAWILDDDKRLGIRVDRGDGVTIDRPTPDIGALLQLRSKGVDVVIGPDTDAAPLPFVATLRMQLLDLQLMLGTLAKLDPDSPWPDNRSEVSAERWALRDSYYDLARCTEHLETPFLPAPIGNGNALHMLEWAARRAGRLLAGESVFRPLLVHARDLTPEAAVESVQRGGSTVFFNPAHLLLYPQTLARFGEQFVRRSDMLVSQLMRDQAGLRLVMHPCVGVRHDRSTTQRAALQSETLLQDVLGYALYRAEHELMRKRTTDAQRFPLLAWSEEELGEAVRLVRKYLKERLAALTLNAWRIFGLAGSIRTRARDIAASGMGWTSDTARDLLHIIEGEMDRLRSEFQPSAVAKFARKIKKMARSVAVRNAFASMDGLIA